MLRAWQRELSYPLMMYRFEAYKLPTFESLTFSYGLGDKPQYGYQPRLVHVCVTTFLFLH